MEEDRILADLGLAAEIEEKQIQENAVKQPRKRFVGRRAAGEVAKPSSGASSIEDGGAIQGTSVYLVRFPETTGIVTDTRCSCSATASTKNAQPSAP